MLWGDQCYSKDFQSLSLISASVDKGAMHMQASLSLGPPVTLEWSSHSTAGVTVKGMEVHGTRAKGYEGLSRVECERYQGVEQRLVAERLVDWPRFHEPPHPAGRQPATVPQPHAVPPFRSWKPTELVRIYTQSNRRV